MASSLANKDLHLSSSFYHEEPPSPSSDQGSYGYDHDYHKSDLQNEEENSLMEKTAAAPLDIIVNNNHRAFHAPVGATDIGFRPKHHHHLSLINFKSSNESANEVDRFGHATGPGSLLSFDQPDPKSIDSFMWKDDTTNMGSSYGNNNSYNNNLRQVISGTDLKSGSSDSRLIDHDINNYQPTSSSYGWLYSDSTVVTADRVQETTPASEGSSALLKRPYMGDHQSMASSKKQCTGTGSGSGSGSSSAAKNSKPKSASSNKDPQSLAAKNRRERISERLKVLQELVPNGPKVDLVTMLEKAISYVKFLQLQVKVLATDEFWPAQGGKAPDISQVKEAIDAILASQRERSSSSK